MKPIMVNILLDGDVRQNAEPVHLAEALGDDVAEYSRAVDEIEKAGRYWIGGGAAPLYLLIAVRP